MQTICSSLGCFATPIALCFAEKGYDLNFTWGVNLHGQKFGGVAMPEMMRWLWRDCTEVVTDPRDMASRGYLRPEASGPSQRELTGYAAYEELLTVRHPSPSTLAPPWTAVQPVAFVCVQDLETRGHTPIPLGTAVDGSPLVAVKSGGNKLPPIFISAGAHSTEQAGVCAAVDSLDELQTEHVRAHITCCLVLLRSCRHLR